MNYQNIYKAVKFGYTNTLFQMGILVIILLITINFLVKKHLYIQTMEVRIAKKL